MGDQETVAELRAQIREYVLDSQAYDHPSLRKAELHALIHELGGGTQPRANLASLRAELASLAGVNKSPHAFATQLSCDTLAGIRDTLEREYKWHGRDEQLDALAELYETGPVSLDEHSNPEALEKLRHRRIRVKAAGRYGDFPLVVVMNATTGVEYVLTQAGLDYCAEAREAGLL